MTESTRNDTALKDLPMPELLDRLKRLAPAGHLPPTERRDKVADVLRVHYAGAVRIVDDPSAWLPGGAHVAEALGLTGTEYAATAGLIAHATDCAIGDAAGQLDLLATAVGVLR